ncbi:MAG: hypothetical protein H0V88_12720 [Pyrinomonadaceae bacterium]|nr:hypothetical protein [Pyrinomonadaceae bacterium]
MKQVLTEALVRFLLTPTVFLLVAALGGLRINAQTGAFIFIAPPLITLILSVLLLLLLARGKLIEIGSWLSNKNSLLENIAHALVLLTLFFASAQAFNSVLPERGLLHWMFSFFFLWTLWNNQWSPFTSKQLLRSLVVLFATAFCIKHLLLANLYAPDAGWLQRIAGVLLEGVSLGTLGIEHFAASTGYISFFTVALYTLGLLLLPSAPDSFNSSDATVDVQQTGDVIDLYRRLPNDEQTLLRELILKDQKPQLQSAAFVDHASNDLTEENEADTSDGEILTIVRERKE